MTGAVYPRWRGEHTSERLFRSKPHGLSPLARGTQQAFVLAHDDQRFIPAGAGNTLNTGELVLIDTVYPRWRGEHLV